MGKKILGSILLICGLGLVLISLTTTLTGSGDLGWGDKVKYFGLGGFFSVLGWSVYTNRVNKLGVKK